MRKTSQCRVK